MGRRTNVSSLSSARTQRTSESEFYLLQPAFQRSSEQSRFGELQGHFIGLALDAAALGDYANLSRLTAERVWKLCAGSQALRQQRRRKQGELSLGEEFEARAVRTGAARAKGRPPGDSMETIAKQLWLELQLSRGSHPRWEDAGKDAPSSPAFLRLPLPKPEPNRSPSIAAYCRARGRPLGTHSPDGGGAEWAWRWQQIGSNRQYPSQ